VETLFRWSWKILWYFVATLSKTLHINFYQNRSSIVEVMIKTFWCVFYVPQCTYNRRQIVFTVTCLRQQSHAVTRKPCDAVPFSLMFANVHYEFKSSQAPKARLQSSIDISTKKKTEFNVKWPFTVIQGDVFLGHSKGDNGLNNTMFRRRSVQKPWKLTFSITSLSFDASSPGKLCTLTHILPETTVNALHLCRYDSIWVCFHSNFFGELPTRVYFETECEMAVQGHSGSLTPVWSSEVWVSKLGYS